LSDDRANEAPPAPVEPLPPKPPALVANRFKFSEYERNIWIANPEPGTSPEAIMDPSYWSHVSAQMRPWDRIEVRYQDANGRAFVELLVAEAGRWGARVIQLSVKAFDQASVAPTTEGYRIEFDAQALYRVVRTSDNEVIRAELPSRPVAEHWLSTHLASGSQVGRI
jgi:hypothetical protein